VFYKSAVTERAALKDLKKEPEILGSGLILRMLSSSIMVSEYTYWRVTRAFGRDL